MIIQSTDGRSLKTLEDWSLRKRNHWKRGRSAYEVANFIVNRNGADKLERKVSEVLGGTVQFDKITPEYVVPFDKQRGQGRVHDLGIWGATSSGDSLFVGVEAKVDEPFGPIIADEWKKRTVGKEARIRQLCDRFPGISVDSKIRYQLMYAAAGTVCERAKVSVFYIVVFVTDCYDPKEGKKNYNDYMEFIRRAGGDRTARNVIGPTCHRLDLAGRRLITIYDHVCEGD